MSLANRIQGALIGFFSGDALAMPVHWYYDKHQISVDFGSIKGYEKPKEYYSGSIMNLSNTGGAGRGGDKGSIVGDVILHGKKQYWKKGGNFFYHRGMNAGDNTLDALVSHVLVNSMIDTKSFSPDEFSKQYISFMTTPDTHNDTYAGSCHRIFFDNWSKGVEPRKCPGNDGHNVDAIDALMVVPPITLSMLHNTKEERSKALHEAIHVTRNEKVTMPYAILYSEMLVDVIVHDKSVREAAETVGKALGMDLEREVKRSREDPMTACYITSAFPALVFYAYKYGEEGDAETMLYASCNGGGENVARTSLLGALVGGKLGMTNFPKKLQDGLHRSEEIKKQAQLFASIFDVSRGKEL